MTIARITALKWQRLRDLARERQRVRWKGYRAVGDYHDGVYDCDWVSPYTKTACNVDADVFVLLQDWASDDLLRGPRQPDILKLGRLPTLPTNRNLEELLERTFHLRLDQVFATNLLPYIKPRGMSSPIRMTDLVRAAQRFALPQIRIVEPALVVCLGKATFNAVRRACDLKPLPTLAQAIDSPFERETSVFWCQAHTGARGLSHRGGVGGARRDWQKMKKDLQRRSPFVDH
jgi:uracil-DNA glycosylase